VRRRLGRLDRQRAEEVDHGWNGGLDCDCCLLKAWMVLYGYRLTVGLVQYADYFMTGVRTSTDGLTMMLIPRTEAGELARRRPLHHH